MVLLQQSSVVVPKKLTWEGVSTPWNLELRVLSVLLSPKYSRLSCFQAEISVDLFSHEWSFKKNKIKVWKVPVRSRTGRCRWARCRPWCLCDLQYTTGWDSLALALKRITSLVTSNRHNHLCLLYSEWRWRFGGQQTSTPWRSLWISAYPWTGDRKNHSTGKASATIIIICDYLRGKF